MRPYPIISDELAAELEEHPDAPPVYARECIYEPTDYFTIWAADKLAALRADEDYEAADRLRDALTSDFFVVRYFRTGTEVTVDKAVRRRRDWKVWMRECSERHRERMVQMGMGRWA